MGAEEGQRQQRRELTAEQRAELQQLWKAVPVEMRPVRDWKSEGGQAFITGARRVRALGVPVRWMAQELGVDDRVLLQIIERPPRTQLGFYRRGAP